MQRMRRFHPRLAECGVRVDRVRQFTSRQFAADRQRRLRDQLRRVRPNRRRAQQLVGLCIGYPFHQAGCVVDRDGTPQPAQTEFARRDDAAVPLGFVLGQADERNFG